MENRKAPLDWSAFTRRPPTLRKGALIRLQDGSMARIKKVDQARNEFELEPAPRLVVWARRALGRWDRREQTVGVTNQKPVTREQYVSTYGQGSWWSRLLCRLSLHDWRDGPGQPCTVCGEHDWVFCTCDSCYLKHGSGARHREP